MIKFPKEIEIILEKLAEKDFEAYVAGECVRDSLLGNNPIDWDIYTDGSITLIEELFEEGYKLNDEDVYRIEFGDSEDGIIADIHNFMKGHIEDVLKEKVFTCNAIAVDNLHKTVDPYDGVKDIKSKKINLIPDADILFKESPLYMLKTVRVAAQGGFDLPKELHSKILKNRSLLNSTTIEARRDELILLIDSEHAGKGLRILTGCELLEYLLGDKLANHTSKRERRDFEELCEGIDKIKHVPERRLGCIYLCFDGKKCDDAIRMMHYDEVTEQHLLDALYQMPVVYFIKTKQELKNFIADYSFERYEYVHNLSKAQRIIWGGRDDKIQLRNYLWKSIKENGEIVFEEDLPVTREEILKAGYADENNIDKMMRMLLDVAFSKKEVSHDMMMETAHKLGKSKIKAAVKSIRWAK